MDKDAIIKQLRDVIDQFKHENESLKACIKELEAKLAMYENAHTPPSLKRGGKHKKREGEKAHRIHVCHSSGRGVDQ